MTATRSRSRRARGQAGAIAATGVVALLIGCQVIVGSDVPAFTCANNEPGACPEGLACDVGTGRCVTDDGTISEGGPSPRSDAGDASTDGEGGAEITYGKRGANDDECPEDLLCGTTTLLSDTIVGSSDEPFCTKPCCTSDDCPSSFVCYGTQTGGNYCIPGARIDRTDYGSGAPGVTCTGDDECRSGRCREGRCVDACCTNDDCTAGSVCKKAISDAPPIKKGTWTCGSPVADASLDIGESCSGPDSLKCPEGNCCENRNCAPTTCRPPCCTTAQCLGHGGNFAACAYVNVAATNGGQTRYCIDKGSVGDQPAGANCAANSECASFLCLEQRCVEPCCVDADCAADEACKPFEKFLHCVPKD